jgi:hypothetical protein
MTVIATAFVLKSLYLAVTLQNFVRARKYGEKHTAILAFKELTQTYDTQKACDILFLEKSDHVKYKVLKLYNPNSTKPLLERTKQELEEISHFESEENIA